MKVALRVETEEKYLMGAAPDQPQVSEDIQARIVLDVTGDVPTFYVNYIEVARTPHDLYMICARIPGKLPREQIAEVVENREICIQAEIQIVVAAGVAEGLIRALNSQLNQLKATSSVTEQVDGNERN